MHMPDAIPENMFAPCGMNCMVCYKHCTVCKSVRPCAGCLNGDEGKPRHCRACAILFLWLQAYRRTKVPGRPADAARSAQPPQE